LKQGILIFHAINIYIVINEYYFFYNRCAAPRLRTVHSCRNVYYYYSLFRNSAGDLCIIARLQE
jgi:hypothetical protein